MIIYDLVCTLFVIGRIVGPIIGIRLNSDYHLFGAALVTNTIIASSIQPIGGRLMDESLEDESAIIVMT